MPNKKKVLEPQTLAQKEEQRFIEDCNAGTRSNPDSIIQDAYAQAAVISEGPFSPVIRNRARYADRAQHDARANDWETANRLDIDYWGADMTRLPQNKIADAYAQAAVISEGPFSPVIRNRARYADREQTFEIRINLPWVPYIWL